MAHRRIGQILVDLGYISDEQLELLVDEQEQRPDQLIGKIAMEMGLVTDEQLVQALAEQLSLKTVSVGEMQIPERGAGLGDRTDGTALQNYTDRIR